MAESITGSTESILTIAGGSSELAKSGSVTHEALCKGVEDSRCSLLAFMMASLPRGTMDKDVTE